jgi:hypothetical protein
MLSYLIEIKVVSRKTTYICVSHFSFVNLNKIRPSSYVMKVIPETVVQSKLDICMY